MSKEDAKAWPRRDRGEDPEAWEWAMGQVAMHTVIPLATHGVEGPRVRPVTTVPHGGSVYVLTGSQDAKVRDLRSDPRFEFYVLVREGEMTGYVRYRGTVRFEKDPGIRRAVAGASGFIHEYWDGPDDPDYTLLRLDVEKAEVMRPGEKGYELLSR